jgi:hypothetical protein
MVRDGFKFWQNITCLAYVENNAATDRIKIYSGSGCNSNVGKVGGEQLLSLAPNCNQMPVILHEIGHSIG